MDSVFIGEPFHLLLIQRIRVVVIKFGEDILIENVLVAFTCKCHSVGNSSIGICCDLHTNSVPGIVSDNQGNRAVGVLCGRPYTRFLIACNNIVNGNIVKVLGCCCTG